MSKSNSVIVIEHNKIKDIFTDTRSKFTIVNLDFWNFKEKDLVQLHPVSKLSIYANVKITFSQATNTKPRRRKTSPKEKEQFDLPLNSGHFYRAFELGLASALEKASRNPEEDKDFPVLVKTAMTGDEKLNNKLVDKLKNLWIIGYDEFAEMQQFLTESSIS